MLQVPMDTRFSVVPVTVQTSGVVEAKVTGSPELLVADSATVVEMVMFWKPGLGKLIDCVCGRILNSCCDGVAAVYVESPSWVAVTEHSPDETGTTLPSTTVQIAGEFEVKVTGSPDVVAALRGA